MLSRRRDRLIGVKFHVHGQLWAEVRRACRDELRLVYQGYVFDLSIWEKLKELGPLTVLEASKINPVMKDIYRIKGDGFRLEGALGADSLHAFFTFPRPRARRHAVEAVLIDGSVPRLRSG